MGSNEEVRHAAETLLGRSNSQQNVYSPITDVSQNYSVNTTASVQTEYVISEDLLAGQVIQGRMSNVRRFFCLFVTFDLAFTGLMWLICIMLNGQNINTAIDKQIYHYTIHTSLFDVVMLSVFRFLILLLFYGLISISHWFVVALSTTITCAFLIAKVFQYHWVDSHQPVFEVLLIITSFVISWGEAWFLDFRVFPQELHARRFTVTSDQTDNERAPLVRSYVQGAPSVYTESVANFYSPMCSPEGSLYAVDRNNQRRYSPMRLTEEQEDDYKSKGSKILEDSWNIVMNPDWKLVKCNTENGAKIHTLTLPKFGKLFKLTVSVNIAPRYLLDELFYKVESIPQWNPALLESHKIQAIDEYTDITYQISADPGGSVSSRDFINIRHWGLIEACYVLAYSATDHPSISKNDKYIRGENKIGCWVMESILGESDKCQLQWILNTNLKGWIPKYIVDSALTGSMMDFVKNLNKHIAKFKSDNQGTS